MQHDQAEKADDAAEGRHHASRERGDDEDLGAKAPVTGMPNVVAVSSPLAHDRGSAGERSFRRRSAR